MLERRYSRWDGTQDVEDLDANAIFDELRDSLLYHGDVATALRELLARGFPGKSPNRVQGIGELLKRLREKREEMLRELGISGPYNHIREALEEVLDLETAALDQARQEGDQDAAMAEMELGALPPDLPGQLRQLRNYAFHSPEARDRFEQLLAELKEQFLQSSFSQMKQALGNHSPEDLARLSQMMGELNSLIERHLRGEDIEADFAEFQGRYHDMLPPVDSLEELLALLQAQAESMAAFMNSLDPSQRQELEDLFSDLMGDMDLAWQMDRFSQNMRALPGFDGSSRYGFRGESPMGLGEAGEVFSRLGRMDDLESSLRDPSSPGSLEEIDLDQVEELLGKEAKDSLAQLAKVAKELEAAGLIDRNDGYLKMSPAGLRRIGAKALEEVFSSIDSSVFGQHQSTRSGWGGDRDFQSRPYEFGDPFNLSIKETLRNAIARQGGGLPLRLRAEDFEVEATEAQVACSTVLLLDLSLSMPLRDNFLPAKKMAMALHSLISSKFPRDYLGIVGFSEVARELSARTLPQATWDYVYGTNIEHALRLARKMLGRKDGFKQILLVTDGEPTAHILEDGEVFFSYPPAPETLRATLAEVRKCTKAGLVINSFVLDVNDQLRGFIDRLSAINRGRVFFTDSDRLGDFVLVDFLKSRRTLLEEG